MTLSRRRFLVTASATGGLAALHPFSARAQAGEAHLRILSTTDLHCHVHPYDYYADRPVDTVGLARTASVIENIRAEATNTMLVDNGDYLQGNPMGDWVAYSRGINDGDVHPVIAGMNTFGYDAGTLGNHEFNYGVAFMDRVNTGAGFPIVCANFARSLGATPTGDDLHQPPYVILDREITDGSGEPHAIRVGFIGFVPPQIMLRDRAHLEGAFATRDIVDAAAWVPVMRDDGADIVVALCHSGIESGPREAEMENAALHLAGVEGIDAVVTGHSHRVWPSDEFEGDGLDQATGALSGTPAVMAGFWGSHMGLIDLLLAHDGDAWRVSAFESEARPIYSRGEDRTVTPLVEDHAPTIEAKAEAHQATLDYVRAEVGTSSAPLHSYFALVADDPSVQIVSQAQIWYVRQLLDSAGITGLPVLSAAAPFKSGGRGGPDYYTDVPAGPIAIKNGSGTDPDRRVTGRSREPSRPPHSAPRKRASLPRVCCPSSTAPKPELGRRAEHDAQRHRRRSVLLLEGSPRIGVLKPALAPQQRIDDPVVRPHLAVAMVVREDRAVPGDHFEDPIAAGPEVDPFRPAGETVGTHHPGRVSGFIQAPQSTRRGALITRRSTMARPATPARLSIPAPKPCRQPASMSSASEDSCTVTTARLPASAPENSAVHQRR